MPREQVTMKTFYKIIIAAVCFFIAHCSEKGNEPVVVSGKTCGICHSLPPRDVGHSYHVDSLHYKCSYCHTGYAADISITMSRIAPAGSIDTVYNYYVNDSTHMNGDTNVVFSSPWDDSGKASYDKNLKQCSNVYCHGGFPQGTNASIVWTRGPDSTDGTCAVCHNLSLVYKKHYGHSRLGVKGVSGKNVQLCYNCHSPSDTIGSRINPATHIDPDMKTGSCMQCHASDTPPWTTWEEYVADHPGATPLAKTMTNEMPSSLP
jgi:predicted CxxxxCH...CXXCH cytochrome family protein